MGLDAAALLEGPRGRHLCLAVAHVLHRPVWSAWLEASRQPSDSARLDELRATLTEVDPAPVLRWDRPLAFADPMDSTVSAAMGWQEPRDEDVVAADPALRDLLAPIADAISRSSAAQWWSTGLDLESLRCTSRYDPDSAGTDPVTAGAAPQLAKWRSDEAEGNRAARAERPDDPNAAWTGHWWSTPTLTDLPSTTRELDGVGSVNLLWEEDSFGQWDAHVWRARTARPPRVYEIDGPETWVDLVRRYPFDVTSSRRQDWYRVTGRDGVWAIPDWEAVSRDFDAVHLSVLGYLRTATRRLEVTPTASTVLAGWDPDQTWWLTDVLEIVDGPVHWRTDQQSADVLLNWHAVEPRKPGEPVAAPLTPARLRNTLKP